MLPQSSHLEQYIGGRMFSSNRGSTAIHRQGKRSNRKVKEPSLASEPLMPLKHPPNLVILAEFCPDYFHLEEKTPFTCCRIIPLPRSVKSAPTWILFWARRECRFGGAKHARLRNICLFDRARARRRARDIFGKVSLQYATFINGRIPILVPLF